MVAFDTGLIEQDEAHLASVARDVTHIRHDLMAVLHETTHVRTTLADLSASKPAVSKRFVFVGGAVCFLLIGLLVLFRIELRSWFMLM